MKKILLTLSLCIIYANAHFLTIMSNSTNIEDKKNSKLEFDISFIHPFEQTGMNLEKPKVYLNSKNEELPLKETKKFNHKAWTATYDVKSPKLYTFFVEPQPYFEGSEGVFIKHVPKIMVSAYGFEDGWNKPLGLKYEIVPLVKPFALYKGNLFQGKVLHNGKVAKNVEVEVELFNEFGIKAPSSSHITQSVMTDENGIFSFVLNHKGWWGFAALIEEGEKEHTDGKKYPIENGALLWLKAY